MKKILTILSALIIVISYSSVSFAEEKRDCSLIDDSTGVGMLEKWNCKKGLPPKEKTSLKSKLKKLNPFKKKN